MDTLSIKVALWWLISIVIASQGNNAGVGRHQHLHLHRPQNVFNNSVRLPIVYVYTVVPAVCKGGLPEYIRTSVEQGIDTQPDCDITSSSTWRLTTWCTAVLWASCQSYAADIAALLPLLSTLIRASSPRRCCGSPGWEPSWSLTIIYCLWDWIRISTGLDTWSGCGSMPAAKRVVWTPISTVTA